MSVTESRGNAADQLCDAIDRVGSPACVGVDPVFELLPTALRAAHGGEVGAIAEFAHSILAASAGVVPAVKFQSACFERYGSEGVAALEQAVREAVGLGLFVVLDAKRGDIGASAVHYAAAAVRLGVQAITVNGYLGPSGVAPFLDAGLGVFVLVRTSNPDSDVIQAPRLADGRTVAENMAAHVAAQGEQHIGRRGMSNVGAVVGATKAADGQALRAIMPRQVFLVPGYGAQGGTADDVRALVRPGARRVGDAGVLVNASRSVIYAGSSEPDWRTKMHEAAAALARDVAAIVS